MIKSRAPGAAGAEVRQAFQQLEKRIRDLETAMDEVGEFVFSRFEGNAGFWDLLTLTGVTIGGKGSEVRYPTLAGLGA